MKGSGHCRTWLAILAFTEWAEKNHELNQIFEFSEQRLKPRTREYKLTERWTKLEGLYSNLFIGETVYVELSASNSRSYRYSTTLHYPKGNSVYGRIPYLLRKRFAIQMHSALCGWRCAARLERGQLSPTQTVCPWAAYRLGCKEQPRLRFIHTSNCVFAVCYLMENTQIWYKIHSILLPICTVPNSR